MSENTLVVAATLAVLAAHIAALIAVFLFTRGGDALLAVNLVVAFIILALNAPDRHTFDAPADWQILWLVPFELLVAAAAITAWWRVPLAMPVSYVIFALHFLASIGAAIFVLTFKITRLI